MTGLLRALREGIESFNSSTKRGNFAPIDDPEWRPRRGWLAMLISALALVIATNARKIIAWAWATLDEQAGRLLPKKRARRRDLTKGYTQSLAQAPPNEIAV